MTQRPILAAALLAATAAAQSPCNDVSGLTAVAQDAMAQIALSGLVLRVDQHGQTVYSQTFGSHSPTQVMPLASASKTMAVAVLLSLVDQGLLGLDDPVAMYLPEYAAGPQAAITVRMCFAHTSGLPVLDPATGNQSITLRQAAQQIAQLPLQFAPGTEFGYGNVSMQVGGAVCEVVSGLPWSTLFQQRLAAPLGLTATDFFAFGMTQNPQIADGAQSNAPDYARFLDMLRTGGVFQGTRILSQAAVDEMLTDQMSWLPVRNTPHPAGLPCGLGLWIERQDARGRTTIASMPGAFGFYGWLDRARDATGVWLATTFYVFAYPFMLRCLDVTSVALAPVGVACSGVPTPACASPPALNATTWPRDGQPDFGLRAAAAPASAFGGVSLALGPPTAGAPLFDLITYLPPGQSSFALLPTDALGTGTLSVPLPPGLLGLVCAIQGAWLDIGGCGSIGVRASRALRVDILAP